MGRHDHRPATRNEDQEERGGVSERFWSKVDVRSARDCWEWLGCLSAGYGRFSLGNGGGLILAHRYSYEALVGVIPTGLRLDHLCRNTSCVNPMHLEPVTQRENVLRGRSPAALNALKTHCPKGHPLSGANLRVDNVGKRRCRACKLITDRLSWNRRKERAA